jgi:hypothetical protein
VFVRICVIRRTARSAQSSLLDCEMISQVGPPELSGYGGRMGFADEADAPTDATLGEGQERAEWLRPRPAISTLRLLRPGSGYLAITSWAPKTLPR